MHYFKNSLLEKEAFLSRPNTHQTKKIIGYLELKIKMIKPIITLILFLFFTTICFPQDEFPNLEGKKILVVYGGWEGHQPEIFAKKITSWLKEQKAEVQLVKGTEIYSDKAKMKELDLTIQHITMSEMTKNESKGLAEAVAGGMGVFTGMWLASSVFLPLGVFLTYKATSDAPIFDSETYQRLFGKLKTIIS